MTAEYDNTDAFREARFTDADLSGAVFKSCDLRKVKIIDSWLEDVSISGLLRNVVVNDVDVTDYVEAELSRRHPERVRLRQLRTAGDYRAMWATIEELWAATVARARRLPDAASLEQVDGEWSLAETLRHLVFATDAWVLRTILDEEKPFHPLGVTHTSYPADDARALGIDPGARPSFAEVMEVRAERVAVVRGIVEALTDDELERVVTRAPAPGYPEERRTVGGCLKVIMGEECEHRRYIERDLAVLEARRHAAQ